MAEARSYLRLGVRNNTQTNTPAMYNVQTLTNTELKDLQRTAYNASLYAKSDAAFEILNAIAVAALSEMESRIS